MELMFNLVILSSDLEGKDLPSNPSKVRSLMSNDEVWLLIFWDKSIGTWTATRLHGYAKWIRICILPTYPAWLLYGAE